MDKNYADEMYGNKHPMGQYRCIEVRKYPWCAGCDDRLLNVITTECYAGDRLESDSYTITCQYEGICRRLVRRLSDR